MQVQVLQVSSPPRTTGSSANRRGVDPASVRTRLGPNRQRSKVRLPLRYLKPLPFLALHCLPPKKVSIHFPIPKDSKLVLACLCPDLVFYLRPSFIATSLSFSHPATFASRPSFNSKHFGPILHHHQATFVVVFVLQSCVFALFAPKCTAAYQSSISLPHRPMHLPLTLPFWPQPILPLALAGTQTLAFNAAVLTDTC